jgi:hypothetical protein
LDPDHKPGNHDVSFRGDLTIIIYSSSALCSSERRLLLGSLDLHFTGDIPGVLHIDSFCPSSCLFHSYSPMKRSSNRLYDYGTHIGRHCGQSEGSEGSGKEGQHLGLKGMIAMLESLVATGPLHEMDCSPHRLDERLMWIEMIDTAKASVNGLIIV